METNPTSQDGDQAKDTQAGVATGEERGDAKTGTVSGPQPLPENPKLERLSKEVFMKLGDYMNAEISASTHEYQLLGKLNLVVANRYKDMQEKAAKLNVFLRDLDDKYKKIEPHLKQINTLHDNVARLEDVVSKLDRYTKNLEQQFKQVYK
eukprot:jgi/Bigna1/135901/aug1.31_g10609